MVYPSRHRISTNPYFRAVITSFRTDGYSPFGQLICYLISSLPYRVRDTLSSYPVRRYRFLRALGAREVALSEPRFCAKFPSFLTATYTRSVYQK